MKLSEFVRHPEFMISDDDEAKWLANRIASLEAVAEAADGVCNFPKGIWIQESGEWMLDFSQLQAALTAAREAGLL